MSSVCFGFIVLKNSILNPEVHILKIMTHTGTSAPVVGLARESAKERETEPMADASSNKYGPRQRGDGRVGRKVGGVSIPFEIRGIVGGCEYTGQTTRRFSRSIQSH